MNDILENIRRELRKASDENTRQSGLRYFREVVRLYGIKSKTVSDISKQKWPLIMGLSKEEILALCDSLWQSGMMEESFIACSWSEKLGPRLIPGDFAILEKWVHNYVTNWASCDTLCNHTVGDFIQKYPEYIAELKRWAGSENRWVKRAAAVSLIIPARRGKFLDDIFEIAGILLLDPDDMVQKGYGWMLKSASQAHQDEVFNYVIRHKAVMPRTALRYAIEKMPADLRAIAMQK
ncbi:MAG: DNA alkylation repair protein [Bacteroidales bacterium]